MNTYQLQLTPEQQRLRDRSRRIAWFSIGLLATASVLLAITLGQSQAMKTAWASDVLSVLPPVALLFAMRLETHKPTRRFPFGYTRAISIAFLVTASVLTLMGAILLGDSAMKLISGERPAIGTVIIFNHQIWAGWTMAAALAYSLCCGMLVGRLKLPLAKPLHNKELEAEAQMNHDEWVSEGAAIIGIVMIGYGFWWADAASAAIISALMIRDGWQNVRQVIGDLMDEAPTKMGGHELEDLPDRVKAAVEQLDWVRQALVRLREHGRVIVGEVLVVPRDGDDLVNRIQSAAEQLGAMDWRLQALTIMPVPALPEFDEGSGM
jgi:cation diffusion facilitator family transporter